VSHQFNFRAEPELIERIRLLATIKGQAMSAFVLEAVQAAYERELKKKPELEKIINAARESQK
jgi:uncharacterized protein (DUF1778 family)